MLCSVLVAPTFFNGSLYGNVMVCMFSAVLRKHHFRQAQMSNAMALLREMPAFNWYSYSKMSQIAYKLKSLTFSPRSTLAKAGQPIRAVYVVHTGLVQGIVPGGGGQGSGGGEGGERAAAPAHNTSPLYLIQLGRGQLIGQWELLRGIDTFQMTYVTCGTAELFELQREHFEVHIMTHTHGLSVCFFVCLLIRYTCLLCCDMVWICDI